MQLWDSIWVGGHLATLSGVGDGYGIVKDGALGIQDGRIAWVGPQSKLEASPADLARRVHDAGGGWITPGLIDCHTHLVFGGTRSDEFEQRLQGSTYEEIARAGGGIQATVRATRATSADRLLEEALPRVEALLREGVTTVEIKSGYGLDLETEVKMLRVARSLESHLPVSVRTTFLGAHMIPEEFEGNRDGYVQEVVDHWLPVIKDAGLADAVDAFLESIAFTSAECDRIFETAGKLGFAVRLHADQLSDGGGARLAARHGALSADHLEWTSEEGAMAMADAGTVAVLLPGAYYSLGGGRHPPIESFRLHGVPMAVATDANPGSSPLSSLLLALNMACVFFHLTPVEALRGATVNAARALGQGEEIGTLEVGKRADLAVWNVDRPADLTYWVGLDRCRAVVKAGRTVRSTDS